MASSGLYTFNPALWEITDEAFERCQLDPAVLTARHARSARASLNFMFADWASRKGRVEWKSGLGSYTTVAGDVSFTLAASVVDIEDVTLDRSGYETPMARCSRSDYRNISRKTDRSRPSVYFVDRQMTPVVYIWQAAENDTDVIRYTNVVRIQDVVSAAETLDVPHRWIEAVTKGLTARLAEKWAAALFPEKQALASEAFAIANREEGDGADLRLTYKHG